MNLKEKVRAVLVLGFLLFVFLPLAIGLLGFLLSPDPSLVEWVNLFESAVVPWWIGIAKASPFLLALLFLLASWADADEIL